MTEQKITLPNGAQGPDLLQIHVLEKKPKQKKGREVYLGLYPDTPVIRRGEEVEAKLLQPGDIVWWNDEPLKVVWIRPWPPEEEETDGQDE